MGADSPLARRILEELTEDRLQLPSLPEIALRVREVAGDDNAAPQDLAAVISEDPALSAKLLRLANSTMFGARTQITDLRTAVTRLGFDLVRDLATALALEQSFRSGAPLINQRMWQTWRESIEVAAISRVLALHFTRLEADRAMLAGLLHTIGSLPILRLAEREPELSADASALDSAVDTLHPRIGSWILRAWNFPPELARVPADYVNYGRVHDGPADYADVVAVARLQSDDARGRRGFTDEQPLGSLRRLGFQGDIESVDLNAFSDEMTETTGALR